MLLYTIFEFFDTLSCVCVLFCWVTGHVVIYDTKQAGSAAKFALTNCRGGGVY